MKITDFNVIFLKNSQTMCGEIALISLILDRIKHGFINKNTKKKQEVWIMNTLIKEFPS